jgi:hypothetical protein
MRLLRLRGTMFMLLLSFLVLSLSTSVLFAQAAASSPRGITLAPTVNHITFVMSCF